MSVLERYAFLLDAAWALPCRIGDPFEEASAPAVVIALVAGATRRIRVGSGAVQMGHQTPLSVVEQFGTLDAVHPGRIDLGLGRSGGRRRTRCRVRAPT